MPETLSPRNDVVFKLLFAAERSRPLLVSLLNAVLQPARPIVSVKVLNPEIQKEAVDDRGLVLDVLAEHDDGTRSDVEMQAQLRAAMPERALYLWASTFRDGLRRGQEVAEVRPCRVIFILAHRQLPGTRFHCTFRALEVHEGTSFSDAFEIHTVELPKLAPARQIDPEDVAVHDWARFLAAETDAERKEIAMRNPDIGKATEELDRLSQDPAARDLARWREDQLVLHEMELGAALRQAREEGLEKGREAGREEGREEGVRTAIEALCDVLAIDLTPSRRSALEAMSTVELTALLDGLRQQRRWPEH